jgi:redox-sensitive bicupin YhaK (pirin superfamily)
MRAFVKATGTNVTLVDIDTGEKFAVSAAALQKLFGVTPQQDEVWDFRASRMDDIAEAFKKWQAVQSA